MALTNVAKFEGKLTCDMVKHELRATSYELRVTSYELRVTS